MYEMHKGSNSHIVLRGRRFSSEELDLICNCVAENFRLGRTRISQIICQELDWRQPNGWLKERACRDVLRRLEKLGIIHLPPSKVSRRPKVLSSSEGHKSDKEKKSYLREMNTDVALTSFPRAVTLEFAKGNASEKIWNELVEKYHYRGHKVIVGQCIKYLIYADDCLAGAIAFSSPTWNLEARDRLLAGLGMDISTIRNCVINNSRFLILPQIKIENFASHVLSQATKQVLNDWSWYYSTVPMIAETFVESSNYQGTCYKAANWISVGNTKGYAKRGASHFNSQEPKVIFLYGLTRKMRRKLGKAVQ